MRVRQISAAIDLLIEDGSGPAIDTGQIGIIGHAAGSVTALMLVGAEPQSARDEEDCAGRMEIDEPCGGAERTVASRSGTMLSADRRIRAALLLAPQGSIFPKEPLPVAITVGIVAAASDRAFPVETDVVPLAENLPSLALLEVVPLADSNVFLAPCNERLRAAHAALCTDTPMVDRWREHALLNDLAVLFFRHAFQLGRSSFERVGGDP